MWVVLNLYRIIITSTINCYEESYDTLDKSDNLHSNRFHQDNKYKHIDKYLLEKLHVAFTTSPVLRVLRETCGLTNKSVLYSQK